MKENLVTNVTANAVEKVRNFIAMNLLRRELYFLITFGKTWIGISEEYIFHRLLKKSAPTTRRKITLNKDRLVKAMLFNI